MDRIHFCKIKWSIKYLIINWLKFIFEKYLIFNLLRNSIAQYYLHLCNVQKRTLHGQVLVTSKRTFTTIISGSMETVAQLVEQVNLVITLSGQIRFTSALLMPGSCRKKFGSIRLNMEIQIRSKETIMNQPEVKKYLLQTILSRFQYFHYLRFIIQQHEERIIKNRIAARRHLPSGCG